jgi:hypothetical protein
MFVIEDEAHDEPQGEFETFQDALAELHRRAAIPWDRQPNVAPCKSWRTCGRRYEVVEYDARQTPWRELDRVFVLDVSAAGVTWAAAPRRRGD